MSTADRKRSGLYLKNDRLRSLVALKYCQRAGHLYHDPSRDAAIVAPEITKSIVLAEWQECIPRADLPHHWRDWPTTKCSLRTVSRHAGHTSGGCITANVANIGRYESYPMFRAAPVTLQCDA